MAEPEHRCRTGRVIGCFLAAALLAAVFVVAGLWSTRQDRASQQSISSSQHEPEPSGVARQGRFDEVMADAGLVADGLVEPDGTFRELVVTIMAGAGIAPASQAPGAAPEPLLRVRAQRSGRGDLAVERSFESRPGELLVVALDRRGRARWATSKPDPLLVRGEFPGADGRLSGQVIQQPSADLRVQLPASPDLAEARIYRPRLGPGHSLDLLGSIPLA